MNIFGLDGIGLLLTLAMSLLVSGVIMFYCLRRFKMLENSLVEQGKVLQSFIMKNQNQLEQSLANSMAIESAKIQENERIEVSDQDDDEYDSDEYDDSDKSDDLENENNDDDDEKIKEIEGDDINSSIENNIENLDENVGLKIVEVSDSLPEVTDLDEKENKKAIGLTKLKVNELRDLAIEKKLDTVENINKLKKEQIIKLINEN
tara:strand:- start:5283 stop:5897 length:615 start_codon:yes stop_codon:yes gene_type:complete